MNNLDSKLLSSYSLNRLVWLANFKLSGQILSFGFGFFDKKITEQVKEIWNEKIIIKIELPILYINTPQPTVGVKGQVKIIEVRQNNGKNPTPH